MKKTIAALRGLLALIFLSVPFKGAADTEVIVTPTQKNATVTLSRIYGNPLIKSHKFVFSESERTALIGLGRSDVAQSVKLRLRPGQDIESFKTWIRIEKLPLRLEDGTLPIEMDEPLISEQWGVKNRGKLQSMFFDQYRSLQVKGVKNEDVNSVSIKPKTGKQIVAVLDTGVDVKHRDLKNHIYRNESECTALAQYKECLDVAKKEDKTLDTKENAKAIDAKTKVCHQKYAEMDTDGNGYPLDCQGWSFLDHKLNPLAKVTGTPEFKDPTGHGTHIAGIIAAERNNYGVEGCTENALILPVKVMGQETNGPIRPQSHEPLPTPNPKPISIDEELADVIARGMLYAIRAKANVINMSLGWPTGKDSYLMRQMVQLAQHQGILIVAAAGNDSTDASVMPCLYPGVLCVGSHNPDGSVSHFSNFGSGVNLAAPGFRILSTFPMGSSKIAAKIYTDLEGFEFKEGTSMAAPFVSCAAAEVLAQGHKPDETVARIMLGARPSREVSTHELKTQVEKYTLSGNLDIKRSLEVKGQPLILPVKKEPISVLWDGQSEEIKFSFGLKNLWTSAKNVRVSISLLAQPGVTGKLRLSESSWRVNDWREGQYHDFSAGLIVESSPFESEVLLNLKINADNMPERNMRLQATIATLVGSQFKGVNSHHLRISGLKMNDNTSLHTITNHVPSGTQDYLAIEDLDNQVGFYLLKQEATGADQSYKVTANVLIEKVKDNTLGKIFKLDLNSDGSDDYILIYEIKKTKEVRRFTYAFLAFDKDLKPLELPFASGVTSRFKYESEISPFPEDFQWVRTGKFLLPAWVSIGILLKSTKPDPWKLEPEVSLQNRAYAIGFNDINIVSEVQDYNLAQKLSQNFAQKKNGIMPVLLNRGEDYLREYATGEFFDGQIQNVVPLEMKNYRMLVGEKNSNIVPLSPKLEFSGTSFITMAHGGKVRMTWLNSEGVSLDKMLDPVNTADAVVHVIAAFSGPHVRAAFTQTNSEMQYHDLNTGRVALTSLNRFSFAPMATFALTTSPVVSWSNQFKTKMPGVQVPAGFGLSESSLVVVPVYSQSSGELERLSRPASLRFIAGKGCEAMGDPIDTGENSPSQIVFFCGDRFIRVPLSY
ncbi:MAG: S8 family serine peptidase [Pseudomonadota bacterium]|nr:S8 family serine peptidase [Pseudomonadota bacterium]